MNRFPFFQMKTQLCFIALILIGGTVAARAILKTNAPAAAADRHGAAAQPAHAAPSGKVTPEDGPHGGKLLRGDGFEVEVTIFETDVPPEFRVYAYRQGQPLAPADIKVGIELRRLGDRVNTFAFHPQGEFLRGGGVVNEPHSFDVVVRGEHRGKSAEWTYESYEGRATIEPEFARAAGIRIAQAGPATIKESLVLHGSIKPDADRVARVGARFTGLVKEVRKQLGDAVQVGDLLAVVESNESLRTYEIKAPQAGIVTERNVTAGSVTGDGPLFVIADHSSVWIDLNVFIADAAKINVGLPVVVRTVDGGQSVELKLAGFLPVAAAESQTRVIRLRLDNHEGRWAPGLRVIATVQLPPHEVPLGVKTGGLQSFRDFTVVFAQVGNTYEVRMLQLGRTDGDFIEVLGGLEAGERYVTANSFLVKADAMKSGASHDH